MARVHHVKSGRRERRCSKCGKPIPAGEPYKWAQLWKRPKKFAHQGCAFRRSDLTGSDKLGRVYDACDDAEQEIDSWDGDETGDLESILQNAADQVREVGEEYRESAENIREHFSESDTADECDERADELDGFADELESPSFNDHDKDEDHNKDEAEEALETWRDEQREVARDLLSNCPV